MKHFAFAFALVFLLYLCFHSCNATTPEQTKQIESARTLIKARDFDGAMLIANGIVEKDSNCAEAHYVIAYCLEATNKGNDAINSYYKCLEALKSLPNSHENKQLRALCSQRLAILDAGSRLIFKHAANLEKEAQQLKSMNPSAYNRVMQMVATMRGEYYSGLFLDPAENILGSMKPSEDCEVIKEADRIILKTKETGRLQSLKKSKPPFSLVVRAMTDSSSVRIYYGGGCFILNWESNESELRVHDPITGMIASLANKGSISKGEWHDIHWNIDKKSMSIYVDGGLIYKVEGDYSKLNEQVGVGPALGGKISVCYVAVFDFASK